ncbi:MAG: hypothetical protein ACYC40_02440, partial [Patescibacteria group bacterium]
ATSTIRGSAWFGSTYSYVYFNCLDDVSGDRLDVLGNLSGGGLYLPPDDVFHFFAPPCLGSSHGVYISPTNLFSGSAWNYKLDYITFAATTTPPDGYAFNGPAYGNCPTCTLANGCSACYNPTDQKVYGYARVINDGTWIKLNSTSTIPTAIQDWNLSNAVLPGRDILPGDFVGTASSNLNDLSFNCESEGGGSGTCATRNYKTYIGNLQIGHLSAPNWDAYQACNGSARGAILRWSKKSGQQTGYEVVVNTHDSFSTSTADYSCWSGKKYSTIANQYNLPNSDPNCATLEYNQKYYWWVRLFDENDVPTQWYQYDSNSVADTDQNSDGNVYTFSTYRHEFPNPYFAWSPAEILVSATTTFTSNSNYYTDIGPITPQPTCSGPNCFATWSTTDAGAYISAPHSPTSTDIIFLQATGTTVTLQITDSELYTCSTSTTLYINYGLPIWREVKAE